MEEFKKILIPTDGSEYTREAIQKGLSLAKLIGAKVTAIYVMDQSAFAAIPPDSLMNDLHGLLQNEGEEAVAHVKEMGDEMGVEVATKILEGSPAHAIVEEAKEHDLIVMGTLGRTGLGRLLLGSVAERVMRHAPCPVMLIRIKEK